MHLNCSELPQASHKCSGALVLWNANQVGSDKIFIIVHELSQNLEEDVEVDEDSNMSFAEEKTTASVSWFCLSSV